MVESVMNDLLSAESGEEFRELCEEGNLEYTRGASRQDRISEDLMDKSEIYEVDFGENTMYFVIGGIRQLEEISSEEVDGYEGKEDTLLVQGDVPVSSVYATTSRTESHEVVENWHD